ncbi:hypothetical protein U9M48_014221 [Paspalum notatum var. saurae]|uniref:Uncharacterized protein n=1 Tax=Paspalum notatum var. saurae TaxID=547442 RepID=A0AAQ3WKK3_PASNO
MVPSWMACQMVPPLQHSEDTTVGETQTNRQQETTGEGGEKNIKYNAGRKSDPKNCEENKKPEAGKMYVQWLNLSALQLQHRKVKEEAEASTLRLLQEEAEEARQELEEEEHHHSPAQRHWTEPREAPCQANQQVSRSTCPLAPSKAGSTQPCAPHL